MHKQAELSATNLVLDFMISEDGEAKVLEFQSLEESDVSGFSFKGYNLREHAETYVSRRNLSINQGPILFESVCYNKSYCAAFVYPFLPANLPWQKVYAFEDNRYPISGILKECPSKEMIVIKIPVSSCGDGVFFASPDSKGGFCFSGTEQYEIDDRFGSVFSSLKKVDPLQNIFVAEECVFPRPIEIDGNRIRPVIRTVLTVSWDSHNPLLRPKVHIHGSYYKLTKAQEDGELDCTPANLKSNVFEYGRAVLIDRDSIVINSQIPQMVANVFSFCARHNPERLILNKLASNNLGDAVVAINYLKGLDHDGGIKFSSEFFEQYSEIAAALLLRAPRLSHDIIPRVHDKFRCWNSPDFVQASENILQRMTQKQTGLISPAAIEKTRQALWDFGGGRGYKMALV